MSYTKIRTYTGCRKILFINFTTKKHAKFHLSLHYNGANSYLFVNGTEVINFKIKDSELGAYPLCLGNILKDWSVDNMKNAGFKGYVYKNVQNCKANISFSNGVFWL